MYENQQIVSLIDCILNKLRLLGQKLSYPLFVNPDASRIYLRLWDLDSKIENPLPRRSEPHQIFNRAHREFARCR